MTNEDKIRRGEEARRILESEIFEESFSLLRERYLQAFENSKVTATADRERVFQLLTNLNAVKTHLASVMQAGQISKEVEKTIETERRLFSWRNK